MLGLLFGQVGFDTTQFGIILQIIFYIVLLWLSYTITEPEGKQVKRHLIPFIGGLYLFFAGLLLTLLTITLSSYIGDVIRGYIIWIGIIQMVIGIIKAFYYKT